MSDFNNIKTPQELMDMFMVSEKLYEIRMGVCESCPSYTQIDSDKKLFVCGECGCDMSIKNKFKNTECPLKKF